ncbi:dihydroorotase [Gimesia maris]|uniref:Dihydroorotase n=1 Tax=Gimesia maris TaxID=122 RepID=A0ABX5YLQ2_9PLAN|nr:dihydroorotase [Gimesia maris]EDL57702.1 dihydroorotase, multifunctional complex type [Gimesia maris DSM 8797]QEG16619.1 Dihydroorotase [Gimesia maris]QGQ30213.1 dihydroorotase [Gimesia maris]|tara:strand:+ start:46056 stop:47336 length:1281 start_codon:yes stop_codon:yes gene_type:complete
MKSILIKNGRIIDPSQDLDQLGNLLIENGKITGLCEATVTADETIDATGLIVSPGFIDIHVSLCEPGFEEDETIESGTAAALAGGVTSLGCLPNTSPVVDDRSSAEFILLQAERAANCHVYPLGAITKNHEGKELAEIGQLVAGKAVGFTDADRPIDNAQIMRCALEYTRMFDRPILNRPQVAELTDKGQMHEGFYSTVLGLKGIPSAAEEIMVNRDIALAELTRGRIHLMCISTQNSVSQIRRAKAAGIRVSADVTPHHLTLTDQMLENYDPNFKVLPPLRSQEHIDALIEGLKDGTIDAICSDHTPHAAEKKTDEILGADFGIIGLETLLPVCLQSLITPGHLSWPELIGKLTRGPAQILGLEKGTLAEGADADITLINPDIRYILEPALLKSSSHNTPFLGKELQGRAEVVIVSGEIRFRAEN